eukprot:Selendium_serpulae@DN11381_c0_g1_i1.p1
MGFQIFSQLLYTEFLKDILDEKTSDLTNCGSTLDVSWDGSGWTYRFSAYPESMARLLDAAASAFSEKLSKRKDERFNRTVIKLIGKLEDPSTSMAIEHTSEMIDSLMQNNAYNRKEIAAYLKSAEPAAIDRMIPQLRKSYWTVLLGGATNPAKDWGSMRDFLDATWHTSLPKESAAEPLAMRLREPISIELQNPNNLDSNSAVFMAYQFGTPTLEERVLLSVLGKMIERDLFDELRSNQQLGYVVQSGIQMRGGVAELNLMVETPQHDTVETVKRVKAELEKFKSSLARMSAEDLQPWLAGVEATISQPQMNSQSETARLFKDLTEEHGCLKLREKQLAFLRKHTITSSNLVSVFDKITSSKRAATIRLSNSHKENKMMLGNETLPATHEHITKLHREFGFLPYTVDCNDI